MLAVSELGRHVLRVKHFPYSEAQTVLETWLELVALFEVEEDTQFRVQFSQ